VAVLVVKHDFVLADLVAVPGHQVRVVLIFREHPAPGYSAPAAKLPEADILRDFHFKRVDA
jgi:hypothetical protein